MDSLIHYRAADAVKALAGLARARTRRSMVFTFAPARRCSPACTSSAGLPARGSRAGHRARHERRCAA
jgi:magnesium-protoporphyrin O-methyltransferase